MKRTVAFTTALYSLVAPLASAFASSGEVLMPSTDALQEWLNDERALLQEIDVDLKKEDGSTLLPVTVMSGSVRPSVSTDASSSFVQLRADNQLVTLTDVPVDSWFGPYVRDVADRGVVSGYRDVEGRFTGLFGPENPVTLEELAKMVMNASGLDMASCPNTARNPLANGRWSQRYISCAEFHKFAVYADGTGDITRQATRAEVAMTVLQAFGVELTDMPPARVTLKDVFSSTLFSSAVYTAVRDGIMSGDTDASGILLGTFRPTHPVNRAETAKILSAAMQLYSEEF